MTRHILRAVQLAGLCSVVYGAWPAHRLGWAWFGICAVLVSSYILGALAYRAGERSRQP